MPPESENSGGITVPVREQGIRKKNPKMTTQQQRVRANIARLSKSLKAQRKRDQDHCRRVAASIASYKRRFTKT